MWETQERHSQFQDSQRHSLDSEKLSAHEDTKRNPTPPQNLKKKLLLSD